MVSIETFNDNAGEILACFELFSYTDVTRKVLPHLPTKKPIQTLSNLYGILPQNPPELQRKIFQVIILN